MAEREIMRKKTKNYFIPPRALVSSFFFLFFFFCFERPRQVYELLRVINIAVTYMPPVPPPRRSVCFLGAYPALKRLREKNITIVNARRRGTLTLFIAPRPDFYLKPGSASFSTRFGVPSSVTL